MGPRGVPAGAGWALPSTSGIACEAVAAAFAAGARWRRARTTYMPAATSSRTAASAARTYRRRLMSPCLLDCDGGGCAGGQIASHGSFQIGERLIEVAQGAEVVQPGIEEHPFVVDHGLKVDAIRLVSQA